MQRVISSEIQEAEIIQKIFSTKFIDFLLRVTLSNDQYSPTGFLAFCWLGHNPSSFSKVGIKLSLHTALGRVDPPKKGLIQVQYPRT